MAEHRAEKEWAIKASQGEWTEMLQLNGPDVIWCVIS